MKTKKDKIRESVKFVEKYLEWVKGNTPKERQPKKEKEQPIMKTIIRWLADISGVTNQIQTESMKQIGHRMHGDHYWWNGGIEFHNIAAPKIDVMNAFKLYSDDLKRGSFPDIDRIRRKVYEAKGIRIQ